MRDIKSILNVNEIPTDNAELLWPVTRVPSL